jgi:hypothetical protein
MILKINREIGIIITLLEIFIANPQEMVPQIAVALLGVV